MPACRVTALAFSALLGASVSLAAPLSAQQAADVSKNDPCPNAESQTALTRCADSVARRADAALNAAYAQAVARSDARRRVLLRDAQRSWIAFRDAHCRDETADYVGGSMYPMQLLFCRASLSDARRAQLETRLKEDAER